MTLHSAAAVPVAPSVPPHILALVDGLIEAALMDTYLDEARSSLLAALTIPAAWADVAAERAASRDAAHEDTMRRGEIAAAASYYTQAAAVAEWLGTPKFGGGPVRGLPRPWPFDKEAFAAGPVRAMLVTAAVYTIAAIERIDRAAPFTPDPAEAPRPRTGRTTRNARRRAAARARKRDAAEPQAAQEVSA